MRAGEGGALLQVRAQQGLWLQHPVFQIPAVFSVIFFCLPLRIASVRSDDPSLVKCKSACFNSFNVSKWFYCCCSLQIGFRIRTSLPFFHFLEFTREVTDIQMPLVAPVILPEMYKIFTMAEV